jgi:hypothetical protein
MSDSVKSKWEMLRIATPVMITLVGAYVGYTTHQIERTQGSIILAMQDVKADMKDVKNELSSQISALDDKLFKHLTNDEIHTPRSQALSKDEFIMQEKYNDRQMAQIVAALDQLRCELKEARKK